MDKYFYLKTNPKKHSDNIILNRQMNEEVENERKLENYKASLRNSGDALGHYFNIHSSLLDDSDIKEWAGL